MVAENGLKGKDISLHIIEVKEMNDEMNLKQKISQDCDVIFCLDREFL
jgi:hypothetical protein